MKRLNSLFKLIGTRPTIAIKFILAVTILAFGVFIVGPWYSPGPTTPGLLQFFSTFGFRMFSGLLLSIPGIVAIYEIFTHRANLQVSTTVGSFGMFLGFLYYVILRFVTHTVMPWTWLFPLACALISATLVLTAKWQADEHGD